MVTLTGENLVLRFVYLSVWHIINSKRFFKCSFESPNQFSLMLRDCSLIVKISKRLKFIQFDHVFLCLQSKVGSIMEAHLITPQEWFENLKEGINELTTFQSLIKNNLWMRGSVFVVQDFQFYNTFYQPPAKCKCVFSILLWEQPLYSFFGNYRLAYLLSTVK